MATAKKKTTKRKKKKKKNIGLRIFLVLIEIIVILLLVYLFIRYKKSSDQIVRTELNEEALEINTELDAETVEVLEGYTTIALFGTEYTGHSDTIIIAAIDNDTKNMKLCSVYRDTYLNMTDGTYSKANAAYADGGPQQAVAMLNSNLDLSIRDFVAVDFTAMIKMVDLLGGIELTIDPEEAAIMNGEFAESKEDYIATLTYYNELGTVNPEEIASKTTESQRAELAAKVQEEHVSPGTFTADGIQTAAYCRIRYTTGWDFKRAERQRDVIHKIVNKAKTKGAGEVRSVAEKVLQGGGVSTSFTNDVELLELVTRMMDYDISEDMGFPFFKNTSEISGSIVVPCDLQTNVDYLHEFLYKNDSYVPTAQIRKISADIIAKTGMGRKDAADAMYDSVSSSEMPEQE